MRAARARTRAARAELGRPAREVEELDAIRRCHAGRFAGVPRGAARLADGATRAAARRWLVRPGGITCAARTYARMRPVPLDARIARLQRKSSTGRCCCRCCPKGSRWRSAPRGPKSTRCGPTSATAYSRAAAAEAASESAQRAPLLHGSVGLCCDHRQPGIPFVPLATLSDEDVRTGARGEPPRSLARAPTACAADLPPLGGRSGASLASGPRRPACERRPATSRACTPRSRRLQHQTRRWPRRPGAPTRIEARGRRYFSIRTWMRTATTTLMTTMTMTTTTKMMMMMMKRNTKTTTTTS